MPSTAGSSNMVLSLVLAWLILPAADFFQRPLPLPVRPQRIVSLSPATTENLYAIGAAPLLVGVTEDCNYPPQTAAKTKVGRFGSILPEKILRLKPDLILATADMGSRLAALKQLRIPVVALSTPHVQSILDNLSLLGKLTDRQSQSQKVAAALRAQLGQLGKKAAAQPRQPTVFYLLWDQPLITAGDKSFIGDVLKRSGGRNILQGTSAPFPHYSLETLLKQNPEALIVPRTVHRRLNLARAPFNRLRAVQQRKILVIDDDLISRPSPRIIEAIKQISSFLYQRKE